MVKCKLLVSHQCITPSIGKGREKWVLTNLRHLKDEKNKLRCSEWQRKFLVLKDFLWEVIVELTDEVEYGEAIRKGMAIQKSGWGAVYSISMGVNWNYSEDADEILWLVDRKNSAGRRRTIKFVFEVELIHSDLKCGLIYYLVVGPFKNLG